MFSRPGKGDGTSGFQLYPVTECTVNGQQVSEHVIIPFEMLKDLKMACATNGRTAPFTITLLEGLQIDALKPND